MKNKPVRHVMVLAAASLLTGLSLPTPSRADPIEPGWDLFNTVEGDTTVDGFNFQGVPLGTYNFGGAIGVQNVGNTDTIIQRLPPVSTVPGIFDLLLNVLQLKSLVPIFGALYGYITLDSSHASVGTLNINAGTFTSTLDVYFDVRAGGLNGPIESSGMVTLNGSGDWSSDAPPDALTIPGVNCLLNGVDTSEDFWLVGDALLNDNSGNQLELASTTVPDASSTLALLLMPLGICALAAARGKVACRHRT